MAKEYVALNPLGLGKQTGPLVPATPTVWVPWETQALVTDPGIAMSQPASGSKFSTLYALQGIRKHGGTLKVMAEPNTLIRWLDMFTTVTAPTGTGPYTYNGAPDPNTDPNYYTLDMLIGLQTVRFIGVAAEKLSIVWKGVEMQLQGTVSALASFYGREIATISTNTLTLNTNYDPVHPNFGLVVGDLVSVISTSTGNRLDTTVTTVGGDGITVQLGASAASFSPGDMLVLRMASPALSILQPFTLPNTHFYFASDAATNLSNSSSVANQVQLEPGMTIDLMHAFNKNTGEQRSGSLDPASLIRTRYDMSLKAKVIHTGVSGIKNYNSNYKQAFLMRAFSGSYEFRVVMNNIRPKVKNIPLTPGAPVYAEDEWVPTYDMVDAAALSMLCSNNVSSL